MSTTAHKERKRAGVPFVKAPKTPTRHRTPESEPLGLDMVTMGEMITRLYLTGGRR